MKRTPLHRKTELRRGKRLNQCNRKRRQLRYERCFGGREKLVAESRCLIHDRLGPGHGCYGRTEAAHVKSRGAGGDKHGIVPLCTRHHAEQHAIGIKSFSEKYGVGLEFEAALFDDRATALENGKAA